MLTNEQEHIPDDSNHKTYESRQTTLLGMIRVPGYNLFEKKVHESYMHTYDKGIHTYKQTATSYNVGWNSEQLCLERLNAHVSDNGW